MTDQPTPARFRHRAEEVEAVQWTGRNADVLRAFCGPDFVEIDPEDRTEDPDETAAVRTHQHGGWLGLKPGEWVLKVGERRFTALRDAEFRADWEPAAAPAVSVVDRAELRDRIAEALYAHDHPGWHVSLRESDTEPVYRERAHAVMPVLHGLTLRELEQLARPNTPPSRPEPRIPDHTVNEAEAPAPVRQRADCTELEWEQQERARFERLYTRETVRADLAEQHAETAARDADIYQQRLERLSDGYTRERKRAEQAEAEAEQLRTSQSTGTFTAADLVAALRAAGAERDRLDAAGQAAVLNAAAQRLYTSLFPAVYNDLGQKAAEGVNRAVSELRRLAAEAQQPEPGPLDRVRALHVPTGEGNCRNCGYSYDPCPTIAALDGQQAGTEFGPGEGVYGQDPYYDGAEAQQPDIGDGDEQADGPTWSDTCPHCERWYTTSEPGAHEAACPMRPVAETQQQPDTETEPESCAHCGKTIRRITGTLTEWWVHVPGGQAFCYPWQPASSPRATPQPAVPVQPAAAAGLTPVGGVKSNPFDYHPEDEEQPAAADTREETGA